MQVVFYQVRVPAFAGMRGGVMGKLNSYLLSKRGLYVLGAGASAGVIPFGTELARKISTAYRDGGSFPVEVPHQDIRTYWAIDSSLKDSVDLIIGGDELHNELGNL